MPPELIEAMKVVVPSFATGFFTFLLGKGFKKAQTEHLLQANKTTEFKRINDLLNEYQERDKERVQENRDLKADIRDMKAELRTIQQERAVEKTQYEAQIRQLEVQRGIDQSKIQKLERRVGELERENAALIKLSQAGIVPPAANNNTQPQKGTNTDA
jgi:hypothetical protein